MTTPKQPTELLQSSDIATLMGRYLANRQDASLGSLGDASEVEPHDAATGFRATLQTTWAETTAIFRVLGLKPERLSLPPEWSAFLALDEVGLPTLGAGFVPQRLRQPAQLLEQSRPFGNRISNLLGFKGLRDWVAQSRTSTDPTRLLVAAGIATALGDWADAQACLDQAKPLCSNDWAIAWDNQQAALLWRQGEQATAMSIWNQLDSAALRSFNLGMAHWQQGQMAEAVTLLNQAADQLPEHSGWSHLARLYSTLVSANITV